MNKFIFYTVFIFCFQLKAQAQCLPDRHGTAWYDGWISCEKSVNPNEAREESHWIMYDFGSKMKMYNLNMWNINAPVYLEYGIQTAYVDYSQDGENWTEYGEISLTQGTGENTYEGEQVLNFNGEEAQFLLITAHTSYGSDCAGFAELKLEVDSIDKEPADTTITNPEPSDSICIIADVYPNPISNNELFITLLQQCVHSVHCTLTDVTGRVIVSNVPISLNETIEILDGKTLSAGVYVVELSSNYAKSEYKVVKQ